MSIEPSALHFDPTKFSYNYDSYSLSDELLSTQFPSTFAPNPIPPTADFTQLQPQQRRLSITSSFSSSGASLSPILKPSTAMPEPTYDDPTAELAHRARQFAGVMLAVPMHGHAPGCSTLPFLTPYLLTPQPHPQLPTLYNPNSLFPAFPALPPSRKSLWITPLRLPRNCQQREVSGKHSPHIEPRHHPLRIPRRPTSIR